MAHFWEPSSMKLNVYTSITSFYINIIYLWRTEPQFKKNTVYRFNCTQRVYRDIKHTTQHKLSYTNQQNYMDKALFIPLNSVTIFAIFVVFVYMTRWWFLCTLTKIMTERSSQCHDWGFLFLQSATDVRATQCNVKLSKEAIRVNWEGKDEIIDVTDAKEDDSLYVALPTSSRRWCKTSLWNGHVLHAGKHVPTLIWPSLCVAAMTQSQRRVIDRFPQSQHQPFISKVPSLVLAVAGKPVKHWYFRMANWQLFTDEMEKGSTGLPDPDSTNMDTAYTAYWGPSWSSKEHPTWFQQQLHSRLGWGVYPPPVGPATGQL